MVVGAFLGAGVGLVGGVLVGNLVFRGPSPKNFRDLDLRADDDPTVNVAASLRNYTEKDRKEVLSLAPAWTKWPDYERVAWINRMIATLWPYYNRAIRTIVDESLTATFTEICEKSKFLDSIEIEVLDLGSKPLRIGGIKTYETKDDEVIVEAPVLWGSNCRIRASVQVRLGPFAVYIPLEIRDMQLHAVARITIRPLVETLPCLGALYISLLDAPHIDMTCTLINNIDLMSVPGIHAIAHSIVQKVIGDMMLFPNQFKVDLMEGGGLAAPPCGMLQVVLKRMEGLKSTDFLGKNDTYCLLEVREGRPQRSSTKKSNNPVFDEKFYLIVDDPESQSLKLTIKDDDFGWVDNVVGMCEIPLEGSKPVQNPREPFEVAADLMKEEENLVAGMGNRVVQITTFGMAPIPQVPKTKRVNLGRVYLELTYMPFSHPEGDRDEDQEEAEEDSLANQAAPSARKPNFARLRTLTNIRDNAKGVLTITLTRCVHLAGKDTYVHFTLYDKESKRTDIQRSSVVLNDNSPRWGDKFDFVMIHANSSLLVTVMEKPGFMESMMTMKFVKKDDAEVGKVRIPVKDVVRNGRLKDKWPLQEVQQGEIMLMLTWTPCEFA